ncbi:MAG: hypothetical protein K8R69_08115 [Deltaproteobacteria bacterium]|nr:hypothetical protein [Deltaproteobacteria bacterium]
MRYFGKISITLFAVFFASSLGCGNNNGNNNPSGQNGANPIQGNKDNSGQVTGNVPNGEANAEVDKNQRIAEWAKFVGVSPQAAADALTQVTVPNGPKVNLVEKIGGDCCSQSDDFKAFLSVTFQLDPVFHNSVELFARQNKQTAESLQETFKAKKEFEEGQKNSGGTSSRMAPITNLLISKAEARVNLAEDPANILEQKEKAFQEKFTIFLQDGSDLASLGLLLRTRVLAGAEKLGFKLNPVEANQLLEDSDFEIAAKTFTSPFRGLIEEGNSRFKIEVSAAQLAIPLAAVTFATEDTSGKKIFLSYFRFADAPLKITFPGLANIFEKDRLPIVINRITDGRGNFDFVEAVANTFLETVITPTAPSGTGSNPGGATVTPPNGFHFGQGNITH